MVRLTRCDILLAPGSRRDDRVQHTFFSIFLVWSGYLFGIGLLVCFSRSNFFWPVGSVPYSLHFVLPGLLVPHFLRLVAIPYSGAIYRAFLQFHSTPPHVASYVSRNNRIRSYSYICVKRVSVESRLAVVVQFA